MPNLWVIAGAYVVSRIGTGLFLFNLYNYTAVAYPTRIRSKAFAWTDGLGHMGAWAGVTLLGPIYAFGPGPSGLDFVDHHSGCIAARGADPVRRDPAGQGGAGADLELTPQRDRHHGAAIDR